MNDSELIRAYAEDRREDRFRELVTRHVDFVYSVAFRELGHRDVAEEVAQDAFVLMARKAKQLGKRTCLSGWLYKSTMWLAANRRRKERRRLNRESRAAENLKNEGDSASVWERVLPVLNQALSQLPSKDREVLLLRYYEDRDLKDVAARLGINEEAAKKRSQRALSKLRQQLGRQGMALPVSALSGAELFRQSIQAAPIGMAARITTTVSNLPTATSTLTIAGSLTAMTSPPIKTIAFVTLLACIPLLWQWHTINDLRTEVSRLEIARAALAGPDHGTSSLLSERSKDDGDDSASAPKKPSRSFRGHEAIDLSGAKDIPAKIDLIVEAFENANGYMPGNALVSQLVALGDAAVDPLLAKLEALGPHWARESGANLAGRSAVEEALESLLDEDDKETILKVFAESGYLSPLLAKYRFEEGEALLLEEIRNPSSSQIRHSVVEAALVTNPDTAVPALLEHIETHEDHAISHIVEHLATVPDLDIRDPLRRAIGKANHWEERSLAKLALERGMPEGLQLAAKVLRDQEVNTFTKRDIAASVRKVTGVFGSPTQLADWIDEQAGQVSWNPQQQVFE